MLRGWHCERLFIESEAGKMLLSVYSSLCFRMFVGSFQQRILLRSLPKVRGIFRRDRLRVRNAGRARRHAGLGLGSGGPGWRRAGRARGHAGLSLGSAGPGWRRAGRTRGHAGLSLRSAGRNWLRLRSTGRRTWRIIRPVALGRFGCRRIRRGGSLFLC